MESVDNKSCRHTLSTLCATQISTRKYTAARSGTYHRTNTCEELLTVNPHQDECMPIYPRLGRPARTSSNAIETRDVEQLEDCMRIDVRTDNKKVRDVQYREFV